MRSALSVRLPSPLRSVRVCAGSASSPLVQPRQAPPQDLAALDAHKNQLSLALKALKQAATDLAQARATMIAQAQEQLLELAIALAQKAMMQELQAGRYNIEPLLRQTLGQLPLSQEAVIFLHPEDLLCCSLAKNSQADESTHLQFQPDEMVQRGQCLVETPTGAIFASFQDRLEDIADALKSPE